MLSITITYHKIISVETGQQNISNCSVDCKWQVVKSHFIILIQSCFFIQNLNQLFAWMYLLGKKKCVFIELIKYIQRCKDLCNSTGLLITVSSFFLNFQPQADAKVNGTTLSSPSTSLQRSDSSQPMLLRVVGSQTSETMGKITEFRLS